MPGYGGWAHRAKLIFDGYTGAETLTNLPVLVVVGTNVPGLAYSQFASTNGADLRFTDADGNALSYEVERWQTNGPSHVWVRVGRLAPGATAWMYWGKPGAARPPWTQNGLTWSAGYRAVWHLAGSGEDATANGLTAYARGGVGYEAGIAGPAASFDGDFDYLESGLSAEWYGANISNLTLIAWANLAPSSPRYATVFGADEAGGSRNLGLRRGGAMGLRWQFVAQGQSVDQTFWQAGQWTALAWVLNGGQATAYNNGAGAGTTNYTGFSPALSPWIGHAAGQSTNRYSFKGRIDEVRVSGVARSADWIKAESQSVLSPLSFVRFELPKPLDAWEEHFFGSSGTSSTNDSDQDGMSDGEEYVAGTCPTSPDDFSLTLYPGNEQLVVALLGRQAQSNWYGPLSRRYRLESTERLSPAGWIGLQGYTNVPGADRLIEYTNLAPATSTFYRARVWLQ
jgi:hypothetical protein